LFVPSNFQTAEKNTVAFKVKKKVYVT